MPSSIDQSARPVAPSVTLVRWPAEAAVRSALAALGQPRLLILDVGVVPPGPRGDLEDWVHWPPDPEELAARVATLRARTAVEVDPPVLDGDGLLRRGDRWVAITDTQAPVVRHLLDHLGRVVRYPTLVEAYAAGGGTSRATSVRTVLSRLDGRLREVGLELITIRRRGVILRVVDDAVEGTSFR